MEMLNPKSILDILTAAFPGAEVVHSARIGGVDYVVEVWQFTVNVSFSVSKVGHLDTRGELRFTLSYHPSEGSKGLTSRNVVLKQGLTSKEAEFKEMLTWVERYLRGVSVAIESVFDPTIAVKTSIFDD